MTFVIKARIVHSANGWLLSETGMHWECMIWMAVVAEIAVLR